MQEAYQRRIDALPRLRLTQLPSPLQRMPRLERELEAAARARVPRLYIKRDDLLGLALGGNKIRNLEFLIGEAIAQGATDVVTAGRAQSNHCRLTAAACAVAGLRAHIVLNGEERAERTGNLLLDELLGAEIAFTGSDDRVVRERAVDDLAASLAASGRRPYIIAVGGSSAAGSVGHVQAAFELAGQLEEAGEPSYTVVTATATGGTQAGMLVGFSALGVDATVCGFAVAKSAAELRNDVERLAEEAAGLLGARPVPAERVRVDDGELGAGYGHPTDAGARAAALAARTEGLILDPVYTAKAFAGFVAMLRGGTVEPVDAAVFLHTGGAPALFA